MTALPSGSPRWEAEMAGASDATSLRWAVVDVLSRNRNRVIFGVTGALAVFAYTILLPYDFTQRFSIANWAYLSPGLLAWSVVLGTGMAFVIVLQIHAMVRLTRASSGALGGLAFVASLLPSFLCCTPILPTVLAFLGLSAAGLYSTSVGLQHFFAVNQTPFLVGSLGLLVLATWMGLRRLAASCPACAPAAAGFPSCCSPAGYPEESRHDAGG